MTSLPLIISSLMLMAIAISAISINPSTRPVILTSGMSTPDLSPICIPVANDSRPFTPAVFSESARNFWNITDQYQADSINGAGYIDTMFSSYEYIDFVIYKFRDLGTPIEYEVKVAYGSHTLDNGYVTVGFELFEPIANKTRCRKTNPYRPPLIGSQIVMAVAAKATSMFGPLFADSEGIPMDEETLMVTHPNQWYPIPENANFQGCDIPPMVRIMLYGGDGAVSENHFLPKNGLDDFDLEEWCLAHGMSLDWEMEVWLWGGLFGLPFDIQIYDVRFYRDVKRVWEILLFYGEFFETVAQYIEASGQIPILPKIVIHNLESSLDQIQNRFPKYVDLVNKLITAAG